MEKYKIELETAGIKYKSAGETVNEAIANLGLSWNQIKAKGVIKISSGGYSMEHLFYLRQLRRIFANKLTCLMWGKRLEILFKGKAK